MRSLSAIEVNSLTAGAVFRLGGLCNLGVWGALAVLFSLMGLSGLDIVKWNGQYSTGVSAIFVSFLLCAVFSVVGTVFMMIGWGVVRLVGRFVALGELQYQTPDPNSGT